MLRVSGARSVRCIFVRPKMSVDRVSKVWLVRRYGPFFSSLPSSIERAMDSWASSGSLNWMERAVNRRLAESTAISNRASLLSSAVAGRVLMISFSEMDLPMRSTGAAGSLQGGKSL